MVTLKISELSNLSGVSVETVRYYERNGLLPAAPRNSSGYRCFSEEALEQLQFIKICRSLGFALEEIKQLNELRNHPTETCRGADDMVNAHLVQVAQKIAQLQEIQSFLLGLSGCRESRAQDCKVIKGIKRQASKTKAP